MTDRGTKVFSPAHPGAIYWAFTMSYPSFYDVGISSLRPEERSEAENRWVAFQPYLQSKGYRLRPRFQPNWIPSWLRNMKDYRDCEDSVDSMPRRVLDATRVSDGRQVVIKILIPSTDDREGEDEYEVLQYFSSDSIKDDPANHVVPCYDSFPIPGVENGMFVVMPLLSRYDFPPFYSLDEVQNFLQQVFEGIMFMHAHDIAHGDIAGANIMMNSRPLYTEPFHPVSQQRSLDFRRPVHPRYRRHQVIIRYYLIDLGYAKWFRNPSAPKLVTGLHARERAPEQRSGRPYDPFAVDVYQLGAVIRRELIPRMSELEFLLPLARAMTERDPTKRPTLREAHRILDVEFAGIWGIRRRWPIIPNSAWWLQRLMYTISGVATEIVWATTRLLRLFIFWR
ncbi:unnamed protein product [Rhizoctonia solani]|uniref:Protein kinase domain-containing protein n=1 Tax=Rhizoctonia solani TaxID=456999 RepID=A0A8H2WK13_9AGAM|nr:unnamed protein product [Rhizoctonia solani]